MLTEALMIPLKRILRFGNKQPPVDPKNFTDLKSIDATATANTTRYNTNIPDPETEKALYKQLATNMATGADPVVILKTIRADEYDFWGDFLMGITEKQQLELGFNLEDIRKPLRRPRKVENIYKVDERGVVPIRGGQPKFSPEAKAHYSKKQSTTIAFYPFKDDGLFKQYFRFTPPIFGLNTLRQGELTGIIFFADDIRNNPSIKIDTILKYDGGTVRRLNNFQSIEAAEEYARKKIYHHENNPSGTIFKTHQELFQTSNAHDYNEVLARLKWTSSDNICHIGIFSNNLKSRIIAQFRAMDAKINLNVTFIPMSFYLYNKDKPTKINPYMLQQQKKDLKQALKSDDPEIKAMAQLIHIYNNQFDETIINETLKERNDYQNISTLLQGNKITGLAKIEPLKHIFKWDLDALIDFNANDNTNDNPVISNNHQQKQAYWIQYLCNTNALKEIFNTKLIENYQINQLIKLLHLSTQHENNTTSLDNTLTIEHIKKLIIDLDPAELINNYLLILIAGNFNKVLESIINDNTLNTQIDLDLLLKGSIVNNNIEAAQILLKQQPDLINTLPSKDKFNLLKLSINTNNLEMIRLFLDLIDLIKSNEAGIYYLLVKSIEHDNIEMVSRLLDKGVNINLRDKNDLTPLMVAAGNLNRIKIIELLIRDKKIELNLQNNDGNTALILAIEFQNTEIAKKLIEAGANPNIQNNNGSTALHFASNIGNELIVSMLITANVDPNLKDNNGNTALLYAINSGNDLIVSKLIETNVDPNIQNNDGNTALLYAINNRNALIASKLIEANADPNIQNNDGYTALHLAIINRDASMAMKLIETNADLNLKNKDGVNALKLSRYYFDTENVESEITLLIKNKMQNNSRDQKNRKKTK